MRIGRIVSVILLSLAVGTALWFLGLNTWFAVAFGLLPPTIAILWECRAGNDSAPWDPPETSRSVGARQDVTRLAWALRSAHGGVGDAATKRVRTLAAKRLERVGLQLDDPADESAIIAVIGSRAFRVVDPSSLARADRTDVDATLSRLALPLTKENL